MCELQDRSDPDILSSHSRLAVQSTIADKSFDSNGMEIWYVEHGTSDAIILADERGSFCRD